MPEPLLSSEALRPATVRVFVPAARSVLRRFLERWRRPVASGTADWESRPRTGSDGFVWLVVRTLQGIEEDLRRGERLLRQDVSSRRAQGLPTKLHLDAGSSRISSTSCSMVRERIRSRQSLSARSMISATRERTSPETSGFHWRSLLSSFSAMASMTWKRYPKPVGRSMQRKESKAPNNQMHRTATSRCSFVSAGFFGHWIRSQSPLPVAVGEPDRWLRHEVALGAAWLDRNPDQVLRVAAGTPRKQASDGRRSSDGYCPRSEAFPVM